MRNLVLALVVGLVTSCATIVSDSDYYVTINSDQETEIEVKNRKGGIIYMGTTPAVVRLASGSGYFSRGIYTIRATRKGYSPTQQIIHADLDGWYFGNIVLGGLVGALLIDPLTGAMWKIHQQQIFVKLKGIEETSGI